MSKKKRWVFRKEKFLQDPAVMRIDDHLKTWADLIDGREAKFNSSSSEWGTVPYDTYDSCTLDVCKDWCEKVTA